MKNPGFPAPERLPLRRGWPDPLEMFRGERVATRAAWEHVRKPELGALFRHYMYGFEPPAPRNLRVRLLDEMPHARGRAVLREYRVNFGPRGTPAMSLLIVRPARVRGPVPMFVGVNFTGNVNVRSGMDGRPDAWPAELVVRKGFGFATFHASDVDPDRPDFTDGVHPWYFRRGQTKPRPTDWGTISAWAWGLSRAADALLRARETAPDRLMAIGHSRMGKAALLAAALDPRFALAIVNQAGCGGSAPSRGTVGESVRSINKMFPHWFNDVFPRFSRAVNRLPFDQHGLVALVAPRPVLFLAAEGDQWANPDGQFEVLKHAEPVYHLLGAKGLGVNRRPPIGKLVGADLGYRLRPGTHALGPDDWAVALRFASARLKV
ncbi:MAG: acetylxylan esterase [Candidatus Coatesbacteria bacterium]